MSRIVKAEIRRVSRPTVVMTTSYGAPPQCKDHVILRVEDEQGVAGWGEATPLPEFTGETADVAALILEKELLPLLKGAESYDIADMHRRMDRAICGNHAAKMAVDTAMHDLNAKSSRQPLYNLLGGKVREFSQINRHIGIVSVEKAEAMARRYCEEGYRSIKVKIGLDAEEDVKRLRAIRRAAGEDCLLRVDANGGYRWHDALTFIKGTEDLNIQIYEQLLPKEQLKESALLRRTTGIRLCLDEGAATPADAFAAACAGAADIFTLKLVKCGGLYPAMQIAAIAGAAGIDCIVANTFDTQINCSACLHLACALPNAPFANDLTCFATQPDGAETCHVLKQDRLFVGSDPGIGVASLQEFALDI